MSAVPGVLDEDLRLRREQILRNLTAREAPRVLILFTAIIVLFDVGFALVGVVPPVSYYVSDAVQGAFNLIVAFGIMRRLIPVRLAPAAFALAIVVDNAMLNFQYTVVGYSAVGVILLTLAVYGVVTLAWRPFLISAVWMGGLTSFVLISHDPEQGLGWALTALTALLVSGVVLYGRRAGLLPLAEANRLIEQLATRDALTGALNRHGLEQESRVVRAMADRVDGDLFAVFVDIAGLKKANDSHGHAVGDLVIERTAQALRQQCRESDLLCRWGGDEFVIIGMGEAPDPDEFAERTVRSIDMDGLAGLWEAGLAVGTASAAGTDVDALIRQSDSVMYERRQRGVR